MADWIAQMVWKQGGSARVDPAAITLGAEDAAEMLALATLTKPGPFALRTPELGRYIGVREEGVLVAMAGERLRLDGYTEVSAVCTRPTHRGRGHARGLVWQLVQEIAARDETPFLHVRADNPGAIRLYASLRLLNATRADCQHHRGAAHGKERQRSSLKKLLEDPSPAPSRGR